MMLRSIGSPLKSRFALMNLSLHWERKQGWYSCFEGGLSNAAAYFCADLCCAADCEGEDVFFCHVD
jgi:hypothetical protein